jgi:O-antigen/teichoic acid export membrane protein
MSTLFKKPPAGSPLQEKLRFLLSDSLLYGSSGAIGKGMAFLTFPLLARHLGVSDYGIYDYLLMLSSVLTLVCVFGQDSAVARFINIHTEQGERRQIVSQSLLVQCIIVLIVVIMLWFASTSMSGNIWYLQQDKRIITITIAQIPFLVLINFSQNILKWTYSRKKFLAMTVGFSVFQTLLLLFAVLVCDAGIIGLLFVGLLSNVVFGLIGLVFVKEWLSWPNNCKHVKEMLPYAAPLGLICIVSVLMPTLERTLAAAILGSKELGLLAAGSKIAMFLGLMVNAFQTAWGPFALSIHTETAFDETCNWVLKMFSLVSCFLSLLVAGVAPLLVSPLFGGQYFEAALIVFPLAVSIVVQAAGSIIEIGITISGKSYYNVFSYLLGSLVSFVTIKMLGGKAGLFGVSLGIMFGNIFRTVVTASLAQKAYPLRWELSSVILVYVITIILGISAMGLGFFAGYLSQVSSMAVSSVCVLFIGFRLMLNKHDRGRLLHEFNYKKVLNRKRLV